MSIRRIRKFLKQLMTLPSEYDLKHEDTGPIVKKYFTGVSGIPVENRIKIVRLIEAMTGGTAITGTGQHATL